MDFINESKSKQDLTKLSNRTIFVQELLNLKLKGIEDLLMYLSLNKFYDCPASTHFHGSYKGGLLDHSINVFNQMVKFNLSIPRRTLVLTTLLHDLCKINSYIQEGEAYKFNPEMKGKGHALLSLKLIDQFIELTQLEKDMIKFHMGLYGCISWMNPEYTQSELIRAFNIIEIKALHLSDEIAAQFMDRKK